MELPGVYISRRKVFSLALAALVIGAVLGCVLWNDCTNFLAFHGFTQFSSELDLADFLKINPTNTPRSLYEIIVSL